MPENSGSTPVRAPPPAVDCASSTRTDNPALAQLTAAASPLGPLPTTVTSVSVVIPLLTSLRSCPAVHLPGSLRSCPPASLPGSLRSCPPGPNYRPLG